MKLKKGVMKNQELADWFGIAKKSFTNSRQKKLEELESFAKFEVIRGGVNILEIYDDEYKKEKQKNLNQIIEVLDNVWADSGLDSCKRASLEIKDRLQLPLKESTTHNYTLKARDVLYGKPYRYGGVLGTCIYKWCKKIGEGKNAVLEEFTEEELEIKNKIFKKYFGEATDALLFIQEMIMNGELAPEEMYDAINEITNLKYNYNAFKNELSYIIGHPIVKGTLVERFDTPMINAW